MGVSHVKAYSLQSSLYPQLLTRHFESQASLWSLLLKEPYILSSSSTAATGNDCDYPGQKELYIFSSSSTAETGNDCDNPGQELYIFIIIINSKDLRWLWPPWIAALHFYHQRQQQSLVTTVINLNFFIIIVNSRDWRRLWLTWTIWQNGLHRYTAFFSLYVVLAPSKPLIQRIRETSIFKAEFWHRIHSNHFSVPRVHTSYILCHIYSWVCF